VIGLRPAEKRYNAFQLGAVLTPADPEPAPSDLPAGSTALVMEMIERRRERCGRDYVENDHSDIGMLFQRQTWFSLLGGWLLFRLGRAF